MGEQLSDGIDASGPTMVVVSRTAHFSIGAGNANPAIVAGAHQYMRAAGLRPQGHDFSSVIAHPEMTRRVADAYNALPHHDPAALPAFKAMAHETERQFDFLTRSRRRGGMGVDVEVTDHDPYDSPRAMWHDLRENNRVKVMSTASTGGHPVFSNLQNDQFRAVHDVFGHMGTGRAFDRHGEEAAFRAHSEMFTPLARRAMATETRGQNSAMVMAGGQFQPQKVALLPEHLGKPITPIVGRRTAAFHGAVQQAQKFHLNAFS